MHHARAPLDMREIIVRQVCRISKMILKIISDMYALVNKLTKVYTLLYIYPSCICCKKTFMHVFAFYLFMCYRTRLYDLCHDFESLSKFIFAFHVSLLGNKILQCLIYPL